MSEYSIDLHKLIESYTMTRVTSLYSEAKKREYKRNYEAFKLNVKAVRAGAIEALIGKEAIKDIEKNKNESEVDIIKSAGFNYQQI